MSSQGDTSSNRLKDAFLQGDAPTCLAIAEIQKQNAGHEPHPLEQLLSLAEGHDRREFLLSLAESAALATPQDCRLLELGATLHMQLGHLEEAIRRLECALRIRPSSLPALRILTRALTQAGRFEDAKGTLLRMRDLDASDPGISANIAYLTVAMGEIDEGLNLYRKTIQVKPDHPQMRLNYSMALLTAGYFQQGWTEHEWRFLLPGHTSLPKARLLPNMTPDLDLSGRHILVTQEEGYGDTLMYLRFLPLLAERGAVIRVWGADIMADLCARVEGVDSVQTGGTVPDYDYHCPFISLPRAFAATDFPFGILPPYIHADPSKSARFAARLSNDTALRVGLVWSGAPRRDQTEAFMLDQRRSMNLEQLQPLFGMTDVSLYSLQMGDAARQLETLETGIIDPMGEIESMDDTAALIDNLDMIISVDTAVVHLAGAMNKPVLLMDRVNPCWRWMTNRDDSPWYPSLRILRQAHAWDWTHVVSSARQIVSDAAEQKRR